MKITDVKLPDGLVLSKNAIKVMKDFISRTYESGEPITIEQIVQEYESLKNKNILFEAMEYQENIYEESNELKIENMLRAELIKENRRQTLAKKANTMINQIKDIDIEMRTLKTNIIYYTFLMLKKSNNKNASNKIQAILRSYPRLKTFVDDIVRGFE